MISKQDRVRPRTVEDLERKYDFYRKFSQQQQQQSLTPYIGENGHWWIGDTDTGVSASGTKVSFIPAETEGHHIGTLIIDNIVTDLYATGDVVYDERADVYYLRVGGTLISETQMKQLLELLKK